jgi:NAD(P)-dependent dehydrogenase (short-subunit alcohol dehydrogenase family)
MRAQMRQMLAQGTGGAIVNVSSGAGIVGSMRSAVYSASKHGVIGLTRSAALQYARQNIRINAICPAGVQTPMAQRIVTAAGKALVSGGGANYPLGRYSTPEEIASGILWLCSEGAGSAVGSVLTMDAGFTAA